MSTIIIRLQNLPLSAKAADIREFFGDLKIPKGSVNIVGGPHGDAFIGFSTDEDARLAMLLDGRLLHNAKIHLMLSSKREMQDVIAAAQAQAQATKSGQLPDPAATQAQNNQQLNGSTKSESITSKAEVAEPSSAGQIQQMYDGSQPPQQLLPPNFPQLFQQPPIAATQSPKTFSGDSWKNPQQQHQTPSFGSPQINVATGQQQTTQLVGQTSPQQSPVFPTSMPPLSQFTMPPPQIPQHQYQQLPTPQLPGFPPPIGQQPPSIGQSQIPPIGGFQQPPPNLSRPPFMNPPPQLQSTGNNDKFFNQPPQQQSGASSRFPPSQFGGNNQPISQQQFFARPGGIQGQQQQFGGRSTGLQGIHGNFRQNQQQQFGRRTPNQTFNGAGQRPQQQQQQFGVQQRPAGNFRPNFGQQQRFSGQNQQQSQQQFGLKRQRSRSPNMEQGANKRFNFPMSNDNTGFAGQGQKQNFPQRQEKQRICIQLSNVPYKATYNDIQDYLSATKTKCIKCTRVYMPDRNYSDRWIVEFDNEDYAREVCKYQGEIAGRTIRAERITPRRADEQYAVMEPEEKDKDNGGNDRRSRRDRDGRRGSRDGNRSRSNGNRDRSRGNLNRGNDHDRPSSREKNQDRSCDRSKSRGRKRSKSQEGRRTNTEERGDNRQKRNSPNKEDVLPSTQPIPLNASLGSFLFPQANQQNVCNAKSGGSGTAQLGLTEGIKPIPLRSTPQFFPTISSVPPPSLVSTFIGGNNNNGNGHVQSPTEEQQLFHQSQPAFNSSWPSKKSATGANAMPLGQRTNASSGPCAISSVPPTPTFNCSDLSFESTIGSSGPALIIDTDGEGDLDGDDIGAAVNRNEDIDRSVQTGISHDQKPTNAAASIFGTSATLQALSSIPDQPPLDLLEPIDNQKHFNASQLQLFPPSSSESRLPSFLAPNFSLDERPLFDSKPVLTPNIGSNEFSQQEVELRPHLQFLNNYKVDPNLKSCLRLENVPKMVFVDQLSDFLGTKINVPSQNIARMFNGVLYINLDNELFAIKAASRNGQFLSGSQIGITQLRKCEMADAIRQNMIIIREMYRVMVVVRGFPLNAQQNEVIALFERFNVNRDAVEKCAVRNSDSHSAFILTFPSTQDCQNAVRELNGVQISGGIRLEVFQPEKFGI